MRSKTGPVEFSSSMHPAFRHRDYRFALLLCVICGRVPSQLLSGSTGKSTVGSPSGYLATKAPRLVAIVNLNLVHHSLLPNTARIAPYLLRLILSVHRQQYLADVGSDLGFIFYCLFEEDLSSISLGNNTRPNIDVGVRLRFLIVEQILSSHPVAKHRHFKYSKGNYTLGPNAWPRSSSRWRTGATGPVLAVAATPPSAHDQATLENIYSLVPGSLVLLNNTTGLRENLIGVGHQTPGNAYTVQGTPMPAQAASAGSSLHSGSPEGLIQLRNVTRKLSIVHIVTIPDFLYSLIESASVLLRDCSADVRAQWVTGHRIYEQDRVPQPPGPTESSCHSFWDSVIKTTCCIFEYETVRDNNQETTTGSNRPDFVAFVNGKALLRGEEKGPTSSGDPKEELTSKLQEWPKGAPFIIGYSAQYTSVSFWIITAPTTPKKWEQRYTSLGTFVFTRLEDRLAATILLVKILRFLPLSAAQIEDPLSFRKTTGVRQLNQIEITEVEHADTESIDGVTVVKRIYDTSDDFLKKTTYIFNSVQGNIHINQSQGITRIKKGRTFEYLRIYLTPVGRVRPPSTTEERKLWLECMLDAVRHLHKYHIVHRDIRWDNMIRLVDNSGPLWVLIDLTDAWVKGYECPLRSLPTEDWSHAPGVNERCPSPRVDIWSLGRAYCKLPGISQDERDLGEWMATWPDTPQLPAVLQRVQTIFQQ
ncbi:hypothetical protein PROFUN_13337 [Planoprotostelium fungivorum]|uniref:Protein kinase domain-containing protein n=1 Tax=Planoprotostelium fungivorum TaxID=1890364 RepID=A0A2P6N4N1_9EUKA|nr:hypothetical protein PROFUN_13337 [Planoprotostelium fungivorum]